MNKVFAGILALVMALMVSAGALACDDVPAKVPVLVAKGGASVTFTDASWWTVTEDCTLAGIKDVDEIVPHMGVQSTHSQYVAGKLDNGWTRDAGAIRTVTLDGRVIGLTRLCNVTITIRTEYIGLAQTVIHNLLGEDVEISANSIAACAMWWDGDYVSMIFHPSYSDRFAVGWVTFNSGEDSTPLYLAHFGEELRFGLACGWWMPDEAPRITKEQLAEAENARAQAEAKASAEAAARAQAEARAEAAIAQATSGNGDGCNRNNNIVQVNFSIFGTIRNWLGIGNKGGNCQ